jgi:hypothetical protein
MIQATGLSISQINGGKKYLTKRVFKKLKIVFNSEKEIDDFRKDRISAWSDDTNVCIDVQVMTTMIDALIEELRNVQDFVKYLNKDALIKYISKRINELKELK